jgi:predicted anti-sigma-YlaC factor YlaD
MNCEFINSQLGAYLDGELSKRAARRVEMHVQQCRRCNDDFKELQNLRLLMRNSSHPQPARAFWSNSFQAIRELSAKRNARVIMPNGFHAGLATVSCLIIIMYLLAVPSTISHTPPPTPTLEPATLVSMHADLQTDLPLVDSGAMRYIFTEARTNVSVSATRLEAD